MKRTHLLAAAAAALFLAAGPAAAQTATAPTKNVDVSVNFTSKCQLATGSTGNLAVNFGNVTAFQASNVNVSATNITFECTRGLAAAPTIVWDGVTTNNVAGASGGATATTNGLLAGLRYQLSAAPGTEVPGDTPILTAGSETNGTPRTFTVGIGGTLFTGAGATGGPASETRTLTVTF